MREQVCVINQRPCRGFSVVKYASAAFRYLVTGIVALVLALLMVLLIVEVGAAIGTALEHAHGDIPASSDFGGSVMAQRASEAVFVEGGS
jgi:uncharacterized membrane protein